jgi:outer membrane protein assembly factor BamB
MPSDETYRVHSCWFACLSVLLLLTIVSVTSAQDPWADRVVAFESGTTPTPGYDDSQTVIGSPERFTGEGVYPGVVSIFNPPWGTDEIVSIGEGGYLVVEFDEPILEDPDHPFGVDLIIFGNGGFVDEDWPNGRIGSPPAMFGTDDMLVSISTDGEEFVELGLFAEGLFPAQGYLDSGPYDGTPGMLLTDLTLPVDPALTLADFAGLTYAEALALYDGSGGGTPIDIAASGLEEVRLVRIDVLDDGNPDTELNAEIDAFAAVPEPGAALLLGCLMVVCALRRGGVGQRAACVRRQQNRRPAVPPAGRNELTRSTSVRLIAIAGSLLMIAAAPAADWTHYAGDACRSGIAPVAPRRLDLAAWSAVNEPDEEYVFHSSPAVHAGCVFVNARRFENDVHVGNLVMAYDVRNGTRLWTTPIDPDAYDSWAGPAVDARNETVLLGCGTKLYALRSADGEIVWEAALERNVVNASPAVSTDLVCDGTPANRAFITDYNGLGPPAKLYAVNVDPFDATDNPYQPGDIVWTAELPGASGNTPAYEAGTLYVASVGGEVRAYNALGGEPKWLTDVTTLGYPPDTAFLGGLTVRNGCVYAASYGFYGGQNNSLLFKLDAATGHVVWGVPCERTASIPIVTDGGLIFLAAGIDGFGSAVKIQAFRDLGSEAEPLWDTYQDTNGGLIVGGWTHQPVYSRGLLYAGTPDETAFFAPYSDLYVLNVARHPGEPEFVVAHCGGAGGSPAVAGGVLCSLGRDGLFAFEPRFSSNETAAPASPGQVSPIEP